MPTSPASTSRSPPTTAPRRPSAAPSRSTRAWPWPTRRWRARCRSSTPAEAKAAAARARELAEGLPHRERSHALRWRRRVDGGSVAGLAAVKEHLAQYPRDAMVLAPCAGVFGLIGFSGRPGREAELLALLEPLAGAYGDDWWFTSALAFAQVEAGDIDRALPTIERSLAINPRNANGSHIRAHVYYEAGERAGRPRLSRGVVARLSQGGPAALPPELAHRAVAHGARPHAATPGTFYRAHLRPGASTGPPLNTLDRLAPRSCSARRWRASPRDPELWRELSAYATQWFPAPGIAFADVHAALAHAFAGDADALAKIIDGAKGPAKDIVAPISRAFRAFARGDWTAQSPTSRPCMAAHERIGGSRAQRDLIEYALAGSLLRAGRIEEARRLLATRRLAGRPKAGRSRAFDAVAYVFNGRRIRRAV